ncbi:MAG: hypothetical protein PHR37_07800 [Eubacteriales bacterium]|nr:hypothetical protein [Eubacteriales bacterium]
MRKSEVKLFAISDLHLAHAVDKPMTVFGDKWNNHTQLVQEAWREIVTDEDVVILGGDISWAKNLEGALPDLKYIENLPGQ